MNVLLAGGVSAGNNANRIWDPDHKQEYNSRTEDGKWCSLGKQRLQNPGKALIMVLPGAYNIMQKTDLQM